MIDPNKDASDLCEIFFSSASRSWVFNSVHRISVGVKHMGCMNLFTCSLFEHMKMKLFSAHDATLIKS